MAALGDYQKRQPSYLSNLIVIRKRMEKIIVGKQKTKTRLIAKVAARFPNGGRVLKYNIGQYCNADIKDLKAIAVLRAKEGAIVHILPRFDSPSNLYYKKLYNGLIATRYEGKCPDLKVITREEGKNYIEYESFTRPFSPHNLSDMIRRGSLQSDSIIIDIRDSTIKPNHIRRQIHNKLRDPSFNRPIKNVWSYDGERLLKEW
ncbi:MAG: hypothetical protein K6F25_00915 [Bacteroidales bacterium]|nr:hypothetical protein [Bacteroidales bacterium]